MEQMTKIEALGYLVKNEIHTSEWEGTAMYIKCRKVITSPKSFFTKYELDGMLEEVEKF